MVHRSGSGIRSEAPETEQKGAPHTTALLTAIGYAKAHGVAIEAQAVWSDTPASDLIAAARAAHVAWVLLGYHRSTSGTDTMGGVVREVFGRAKALPIQVDVFIQGTDRPIERVFAAVDARPDGGAALDLGARIARKNRCKLHLLLVSKNVAHPEADLLRIIREVRVSMRGLVHTDVLTKRSLEQLFRQAPGRLLIVGKTLADEVGLPLDEVPGGDRCVIVVQGGETSAAKAAGSSRRPRGPF